MSLKKLDSRKLIIGLVYSVLIIVNDLMGNPVSQEAVFGVAGLLGAVIIGLGIADSATVKGAITSGAEVAEAVTDAIDSASDK